MSKQKFSTLELIELPPMEREIFLYLSRGGPADAETMTEDLGHEISGVQDILVSLIQKGRIIQVGEMYEVVLGQITRRTTLPPYVLSAFLATDRLYSEQEIVALRTAVPMLQFARARLSVFTDHGPSHALRVKSFATQLGSILGLSPKELHLLRAGAIFHDIGNVVDRDTHNVISQETVEQLTVDHRLPYNPKESKLIGLLCRWHRKEYDAKQVDFLGNQIIRTGLLASALRVADAMDIDYRRSDYTGKFRDVLEFFFPENLRHWTSADEILGVRIYCSPNVKIQIFTRGKVSGNLQIEMLREDLLSTPLDITIEEIPIEEKGAPASPISSNDGSVNPIKGDVLIIFPFEPHSIIMAGLSKRNLVAEGCSVKTLSFPNLPTDSHWLRQEYLPSINFGEIDHLIVIGDHPDFNISSQIIQAVKEKRDKNLKVSILSRYEVNWSRFPEFLDLGVEIILGGDWVYFWGNPEFESDFVWGRIAALCTRDPTQAAVEITSQELAVQQGLIQMVYDSIYNSKGKDIQEWVEIAESFVDRVVENDLDYFSKHSNEFLETYAEPITPSRTDGNVAVFEQSDGEHNPINYWVMEAAIEQHGRASVRGIQFNIPYAVSLWDTGDFVELLGINHWRDEVAIPIRLLYPSEIAPPPQGNESTIRARLPRNKAKKIVQALISECNRSGCF